MDFIGSKQKLNTWMFSHINRSIRDQDLTKPIVFLDACAGSGSTSFHAIESGFSVISNDLMEFPSHIIRGGAGLTPTKLNEARDHIQKMNGLRRRRGFFSENYCVGAGRAYMTDLNAGKLDACRFYIDSVQDEIIKSYLIYCTLEALSRVSNTTGVQAAFLKSIKDRAKSDLIIREERHVYSKDTTVHTGDILTLLQDDVFRSEHQEDILYIDPPYNSRQYGPNYHLYETLAKNDSPVLQTPVAGLRDWQSESKSDFCSKKKWEDFTKTIIESTTAKVVFMSYSRDGLLSVAEIEELVAVHNLGSLSIHCKPYTRYRSDKKDSGRSYDDSFHSEYLFEITKT